MKRSLLLIIIIFSALTFIGCKSTKNVLINSDKKALEKGEESLSYKVDQILLSKSFQSTEPSVEVTTKKNQTKVSAFLDLTESSGVTVNKVIKKGSDINIHVSGIYDNSNLELSVPQIVLEIKKPRFNKIEDFKFNIVYDDYQPIKIKLGINEVLSKIQSHFKISSNSAPIVNLTRVDEDILWDISYKGIFDRQNSQIPLINFTASVNANSGDIITSEKTFISSAINQGHILYYVPDNYFLYKNIITDKNDENPEEQLWYYDISEQEGSMLFSSKSQIQTAKFSPDLSYISLIEVTDNNTSLYIIPRADKKAYKVSFEDKFNPKIMCWKDDNNLYLIENHKGNSLVFSHDIANNITTRISHVNKNIEDLLIQDDTFIIVESSGDQDNYTKKISSTTDWKNFDFKANGFSPRFINNKVLGYLRNDEKSDSNSLYLYDLEDNKTMDTISKNITSFQPLSDGDITYVQKNPKHSNFTLYHYPMQGGDPTHIMDLICDKAYYDPTREYVYLSVDIPFENDTSQMIYSIDLDKLD